MEKERREKGFLEIVLDKAIYKTGFVCAKVVRLKDKLGSQTVASGTEKDDLVAAENENSVKEEIEPIGAKKSAQEKKKIGAVGKKAKAQVKEKLKSSKEETKPEAVRQKQAKRETRAFSTEIINEDFEKEIEKIDKEVDDI